MNSGVTRCLPSDRRTWVAAGLTLLVFGALNYYTHIGLLVRS